MMRKARRMKSSTLRRLEGLLFMMPWIAGFLLFMAFPLGFSFYMSFQRVQVSSSGVAITYRGLAHYRYILFENADILYNRLIPFLRQALLMLPIIVIFSLLVAIMLNQKFWGRTFFRAVFFLPVIFTTGQVILEFVAQGKGDLDFLERYNLSALVVEHLPPVWANPIMNIMDSIVLVLWYSGVQILIFLAGRQTISPSVYEASRIDGAGPWEVFWKITLPAMLPFILLNIIYTTVDLFTFPSNPIVGMVIPNDYGLSSAVAWIYFAMIFVFLGIFLFLFSRATRGFQPAGR